MRECVKWLPLETIQERVLALTRRFWSPRSHDKKEHAAAISERNRVTHGSLRRLPDTWMAKGCAVSLD